MADGVAAAAAPAAAGEGAAVPAAADDAAGDPFTVLVLRALAVAALACDASHTQPPSEGAAAGAALPSTYTRTACRHSVNARSARLRALLPAVVGAPSEPCGVLESGDSDSAKNDADVSSGACDEGADIAVSFSVDSASAAASTLSGTSDVGTPAASSGGSNSVRSSVCGPTATLPDGGSAGVPLGDADIAAVVVVAEADAARAAGDGVRARVACTLLVAGSSTASPAARMASAWEAAGDFATRVPATVAVRPPCPPLKCVMPTPAAPALALAST